MKTVPIAQFRAKLRMFLERVKSGIEYVVTDHGKPVARVVPIAIADSSTALGEMALTGQIRLPRKKPAKGGSSISVNDPDGRVLALLLGERENTR